MIGATAAMGFIVGIYGVLAIALTSPGSGITQSILPSLALPLVASAIGALLGVLRVRSLAGEAQAGQGGWSQGHTA